ncbi:MAG: leucine-rich repeat domain-containing protein [Clostridia bacterium]|nr:leucine-rich repeat domain-containing protein [Clostridia bacterium]
MKRFIAVTLFAVLVCFCFVSCGGNINLSLITGSEEITYEIENGEATVTKVPNKTTVTKIAIPDEYEGVPVTKIADFAAVNLEYVTEITIGKNVREISDWAFGNSKRIEKYIVDAENPYISDVDGVLYTEDMKTLLFYPPARGAEAEKEADGTVKKDESGNTVRTITYAIPEGVETVRSKAFYKCYDMKHITLPSTLKYIEEKAFFSCNLQEIILPDGLETIGKDAFSFNSSVTEITIPASVIRIDEFAFYTCTSMLKLTMLCNENEVTLGERWYPTNNGQKLNPEPEIIWP